jgi:hypothetical protein
MGRRVRGYSSVKQASRFLTVGKTAATLTCCIAGMTTYHDELKWRRHRYLRDCMLCRWGSIRHCDFALSYPHLGIAERWDLLRQRERAERWHPFRYRSGDVNLRPPLPASHSDHSLGRNARYASVYAGSRRRGVAGRRHLDCVPRSSWPLIRTIAARHCARVCSRSEQALSQWRVAK